MDRSTQPHKDSIHNNRTIMEHRWLLKLRRIHTPQDLEALCRNGPMAVLDDNEKQYISDEYYQTIMGTTFNDCFSMLQDNGGDVLDQVQQCQAKFKLDTPQFYDDHWPKLTIEQACRKTGLRVLSWNAFCYPEEHQLALELMYYNDVLGVLFGLEGAVLGLGGCIGLGIDYTSDDNDVCTSIFWIDDPDKRAQFSNIKLHKKRNWCSLTHEFAHAFDQHTLIKRQKLSNQPFIQHYIEEHENNPDPTQDIPNLDKPMDFLSDAAAHIQMHGTNNTIGDLVRLSTGEYYNSYFERFAYMCGRAALTENTMACPYLTNQIHHGTHFNQECAYNTLQRICQRDDIQRFWRGLRYYHKRGMRK